MPEGLVQPAAAAFVVVTAGAVAFQLALALGVPWGGYAMGGAFQGRFPPRLRVAAVAQAVVLAVLAGITAARAGLIDVGVVDEQPSLVWLVVAFSALSLVLNAISRSAGERRIWVPVAIAMLASSLVVALGAG
ncbi:MAG: hypothetical protein L0227_04240 [Chloroflexi bacterium]|nr:hypothetical protein [Chloroflexota bacterium]